MLSLSTSGIRLSFPLISFSPDSYYNNLNDHFDNVGNNEKPWTVNPFARSDRSLALLNHRTVFYFVGLLILSLGHLWFQARMGYDKLIVADNGWTSGCLFLIVYVPTWLTIFSICVPISKRSSGTNPDGPVRELRRLHICIVTRGTNVDATVRSWRKMHHLQQYDSRITISICTDQAYEHCFKDLGVNVVATPNSFRPLRARYKARALEWFARSSHLGNTDWVLHLDEESIVDEHTVEACIEFAEQQDQYNFGQGIILYNAFNFWRHKLITFADIVRGRDDLSKFYLAHNYFHIPVFGIHGSFLLINGQLENEIGWDTDSLVEDFWFGLQAWNKGHKLGWIRSIAREQSPMGLTDLCKQRRRWFSGMIALPGIWGKLACFQWCLSSIGVPAMFFFQWWGLRLPFWAYVFVTICAAGERLTLMSASAFQDIDAGIGILSTVGHAILCPIVGILANTLDMATILYTLFSPAVSFHVVRK